MALVVLSAASQVSATGVTAAAKTLTLSGTDGPYGPGLGPGITFERVLTPHVNAAGQYAFGASLNNPANPGGSSWTGGGPTFAPLALPNDLIPGMGGARYSSISQYSVLMNEAGEAIFTAYPYNATPANFNALTYFTASSGTVSGFARQNGGGPTPGSYHAISGFMQSGWRSVAYYGANTQAELWVGVPGNVRSAAKVGTQAPGMPAGTLFSNSIYNVDLNSAGQLLFSGSFQNSSGSALFLADSQSTSLQLRTTDAAPGRPTGTTFGQLGIASLNDDGQIGVVSTAGVYVGRPGSMRLEGYVGGPVPGMPAGVTFIGITKPNPTSPGTFVINAEMQGPGVTTPSAVAIFRDTGSGPSMIVRGGQTAPGLNAGETLVSPGNDATNALGQFIVDSTIAGPGVTSANNRGIWIWDPQNGLLPLARKGEGLLLGTGATKTISSISDMWLSVLSPGSPIPGSSDLVPGTLPLGLATYTVDFTDGTSGTFARLIVPAPSAFCAFTLLAAPLARRSRRPHR